MTNSPSNRNGYIYVAEHLAMLESQGQKAALESRDRTVEGVAAENLGM